jgi:phosphoribosylamine-glycine ligase
MRVLVLGKGEREHAPATRPTGPGAGEAAWARGNPGMAAIWRFTPAADLTDPVGLLQLAVTGP